MICRKTTVVVGGTASFVASVFVISTSYIMHYRLRLLKFQLRMESVANGYAEDALSMGETVAAFDASE
jgi:sensor histidine kinase YesM